MRLRYFLLFCAWFGCDGARAQTSTRSPDCIIKFSFAVAAAPIRSAGFPNKVPSVQDLPCTTWAMNYQAPTTVSAISIELDSAADTAGAPGAWAAFAGTTIVTSANPLLTASLPAAFLARQGSPAWVSVNLNSATGTGTITGAAYGWILAPFSYSSATFTPSGSQDVNLIQVDGSAAVTGGVAGSQGVGGLAVAGAADAGNPVKVGGSNGTNDYNLKVDSQGNNYNFLACTSTAEVALSGTGYTEIVVGTALQTVQICKVFVTSVAAGTPVLNTFSIASATISTCAGSTELYSAAGITGMDSDWGGALRSAAGKSICVSEAVANSDKVTISYAKGVF